MLAPDTGLGAPAADSLFVYDQGLSHIVVLNPEGVETKRIPVHIPGEPIGTISHLEVLDDSTLLVAREFVGRATVGMIDRESRRNRTIMAHPQPVAWRPDGLLRALLVWTTSLTTLVFWLPALRGAFDGRSYEWGLGGLRGAGLSGDYWFPVAVAAFACWLVTCGWRRPRRSFHWLFVAWHAALAIGVLALAVIMGRDFTLQGDTLGMSVPLWWVGPTLFGGVAGAAELLGLLAVGFGLLKVWRP